MPRGRPRHDDVLTPREWQVLGLLRDGLSNEAIAERLGISSDTAKFHVSEILTKLGVANRQEAARWQGEPRRSPAWLAWPLRLGGAGLIATLLIALHLTTPWSKASHPIAVTTVSPDTGFDGLPADEPTPRPYRTPVAAQITVCTTNDTWQKPSLDEQEAHIDSQIPRTSGFNDMARSSFNASFWFPSIGADPVGAVIDASGLWTLPDVVKTWNDGCNEQAQVDWMDVRYAWLLGYEATSASYQGDQLIVHVEPKLQGYEVVMLRFPEAVTYAGSVDFVDSAGRTVGRTGIRADFPEAACFSCRVDWSVKP